MMNITSKALARICVVLLVLYPVSALLVWTLVADDDHYGVLAALFAANAGTALFVGLAFSLPEYSSHTSRTLRLLVPLIGVVCAVISAMCWMWDEVDNVWLRVGIVSPIVFILLVLGWFTDKVNKEGAKHEEDE